MILHALALSTEPVRDNLKKKLFRKEEFFQYFNACKISTSAISSLGNSFVLKKTCALWVLVPFVLEKLLFERN
jgi:hypothetical protein